MKSRFRPRRSVKCPKRRAPAHAAGDIDAGGVAHLGGRDSDPAVRLGDRAADGADDRDLEPVEYPHRSETDQDHPMPVRPRQSVEAGRDGCLDDGAVVALDLGELAAGQLHRACCRLPSDIDVLLVQVHLVDPDYSTDQGVPCGTLNRYCPVDLQLDTRSVGVKRQ